MKPAPPVTRSRPSETRGTASNAPAGEKVPPYRCKRIKSKSPALVAIARRKLIRFLSLDGPGKCLVSTARVSCYRCRQRQSRPRPVHPIGYPADDDIDQGVSDREHVLGRQCPGLSLLALDRPHRDLLVGKSLVQQHADDVGLKSEASRVRMPAHHVVAQVDGKPIV